MKAVIVAKEWEQTGVVYPTLLVISVDIPTVFPLSLLSL
jgi:hypothetical protein